MAAPHAKKIPRYDRPALERIVTRMVENAHRVRYMVGLYKLLANKAKPDEQVRDILRFSTVFIHASLEDLLRSVAALHLPHGQKTTLDKIPLQGLNHHPSRAEKFYLGDLLHFRHTTVDRIIRQSVDSYLSKVSFSSTNDIAAILIDMGFPVANFQKLWPPLAELMRRRHQIVHQADFAGRRSKKPQAISVAQVTKWNAAYGAFAAKLIADNVAVSVGRVRPKQSGNELG
jgi:hypothetical protein